ncbi:MAG: hypothetical protein ABFR32_03805 [Bacteroidota bacterium]
MKNIIKYLLLLLVSVSFSACDALDDLTEEQEPMYFTIPVDIAPTDGVWANYNYSNDINIQQWMGEWFDKLESIKVIKVSYQITEFQGDENGQVKAKLDVNNIITLQDEYVVNDAFLNHTIFELKDIEKAINKNGNISVKYSGSALCGEGGLHFTVKVTVTILTRYSV